MGLIFFWVTLYMVALRSVIIPLTVLTFDNPKEKGFENTVGKEENAGNQHFLFFPQCFQLHLKDK